MAQILQARKPSTVSQASSTCMECTQKGDIRRHNVLRTFPLCLTYPCTFKHWKPQSKLLYSLQRCSPLPKCNLKAYWNLILVTGVFTLSLKVPTSAHTQCPHVLPQGLGHSWGLIPSQLPSQRESHSRWEQHQQLPPLCRHPLAQSTHTQTLQTGLLPFTDCASWLTVPQQSQLRKGPTLPSALQGTTMPFYFTYNSLLWTWKINTCIKIDLPCHGTVALFLTLSDIYRGFSCRLFREDLILLPLLLSSSSIKFNGTICLIQYYPSWERMDKSSSQSGFCLISAGITLLITTQTLHGNFLPSFPCAGFSSDS